MSENGNGHDKKKARRHILAKQMNGDGASPYVPPTNHMKWYAEYSKLTRSMDNIAQEYGVSQQAVSAAIKKVNRWLWQENLDDIKAIKTQHVQMLENISREAMRAWVKSKDIALMEVSKEGESNGEKGGSYSEKSTTERHQCGDAQYLNAAMKALEQIRKITGADIPMEVTPDDGVRFAGQSRDKAIQNRIKELQGRLEPSKN